MSSLYQIVPQLNLASKLFSQFARNSTHHLLNLSSHQKQITEKETGKMRLQGGLVLAFAVTAGMLTAFAGGLAGVSAPNPLPQLATDNLALQALFAAASKLRDPRFMQVLCKAAGKGLSHGGKGAETLIQSEVSTISSSRSMLERIALPHAQEGIRSSEEATKKTQETVDRLIEKRRQSTEV
ncbi:MAG: hypothetical protein HYZ48_02195 [Chlamydiales bacterium]|nr:hypothetical protein [Chlamydiales bacterium]